MSIIYGKIIASFSKSDNIQLVGDPLDLNRTLRLSYYQPIGFVDESHDIKLVKHTMTGRLFVMKHMEIYDLKVLEYLKNHPSPGFPRIEELIQGEDCLYVVEDYVSGLSLRILLENSGPMTETQAVDLAAQLCRILAPLHKQNPPIVHRDIKPENLIVTDSRQVVLVDFDAAKKVRSGQSQDTVLIGTQGYAAPEQYGFSSSNPATDVYAIGVLLNEMLTGVLPSEALYEGRLGHLIQKCIMMDPQKRYRDADALLRALMGKPREDVPPRRSQDLSWKLPGFRGKSRLLHGAAVCGYLFVLYLSTSLKVEGSTSPLYLLINRIWFVLTFLGEILWLGNYREVWKLFPLSNSSHLLLKIFGIAGWAFIFLFPPALLLVLAQPFFL